MRKFRVLSLFTILALLLTACGGTTTQPEATQTPIASQGETPAGDIQSGDRVTLIIESWRNDDLKVWSDTIIPAFEAKNPNIHVEFAPTAPTEYNAALNTKLEGGTAGDLVT